SLIDDLRSEDPERVAKAQLHLQPGGYACSTPEIDEMVDLSLQVPGVLGAQLSGAGLGGCIMVLVRSEAKEQAKQVLTERFYMPRGLTPQITESTPVMGSTLVSIPAM
ncbi:MAG: galactokinase, partial [Firmicutes bacterium]|nr:galactokinase [Bacillota bacterium]